MLTTAVCVGVYTAVGVVKVSPDRAFREIPAFVFVGIIYGALMILLPNLATWLPRNLF
jgi:C4-dicarboxylate transporter DctM subunit